MTFDGTGISVFELKREIITQSRLGDGTDFELSIYNEDTGEGTCLDYWNCIPDPFTTSHIFPDDSTAIEAN